MIGIVTEEALRFPPNIQQIQHPKTSGPALQSLQLDITQRNFNSFLKKSSGSFPEKSSNKTTFRPVFAWINF